MIHPDIFVLKEALASVALSHEAGCQCLTCRASHGDEEAFARILADFRRRSEK